MSHDAKKAAKDRRSRQNNTRLSAGGSLSPHQQMLLMAERDSLREQVATVTRDLESERARYDEMRKACLQTMDQRDAAKAEAVRLAEALKAVDSAGLLEPAHDCISRCNPSRCDCNRDELPWKLVETALASTDAKDWLRAEKMRIAEAAYSAGMADAHRDEPLAHLRSIIEGVRR